MKTDAGKLVFALALLLMTATAAVGEVAVDADGKPVAGLSVQLLEADSWSDKVKVEGSATTGADGAFSFPPVEKPSLYRTRMFVAYKPGEYLGWLCDASSVPAEYRQWLAPASDKLVLHPLGTASGKATDAKSKPVAGVRVAVSSYSFKSEPTSAICETALETIGAAAKATADANGRYELKDVPKNAEVFVRASKTGYAMQNLQGYRTGETIVLAPEGRVIGRVVDAAGKPLAGVKVCPVVCGKYSASGEPTSTGQDGSFVIRALRPGKYDIFVQSPDGYAAPARNTQVTSGGTAKLDRMVLRPFVNVSGKVTPAEAGVSLEGMTISAFPMTGQIASPSSQPSVVGADGRFTVKTMPGKNFLTYGGLPQGFVTAPTSMDIDVPKEGLSGLEIKLVKAEIGSGKVVDAQGKPIAGALVRGDYGMDSTTTDAEGCFTLTLRPPETHGEFSSPADSQVELSVTDVRGKRAAKVLVERDDLIKGSVVVTAKPTRSFIVRVKSSSGKPLPGAKIYLTEHLSTRFSTTGESSVADSSGKSSFTDLIEGSDYSFSAAARGYFDTQKRKPTRIGAASAPRELTIVMQRANRAQKGRVIDENGRPVRDAEVTVEMDHGRGAPTARTDAKGWFTLRDMPDSPVTLSVSTNTAYGSATASKYTGPVVIQLIKSMTGGPDDW